MVLVTAVACGAGGTAQGSGSGEQASIEVAVGDAQFVVETGGVATPALHSWAMSNPSQATFFYELRVDQAWVRLPTSPFGSVDPGQQVNATITLDPVAVAAMAQGTYSAVVQFRDATADQVTAVRNVTLTVNDPPPPPPPPPPPTGTWTPLVPSGDSRIIYVSTSGNDSNNGLSEQTPKRTIAAAKALIRNGFPDWLRLRKGDVWSESIGNWTTSGRSVTEPQVITSYGTGARPQLRTGGSPGLSGTGGGSRSWLTVVDIHFRGRDGALTSGPTGISFLTPVEGLLIEGCMVERYMVGVVVQGLDGTFNNVRLRRNTIIDSYSVDAGHAEGLYLSNINGLLLEENIIDHNGWIDVPQATPPTMFRHNVYIQNDCSNVTVRGNYILGASANGLSMRSAGTAEDNILARNSIALLLGANGGVGSVRRNVVMEGKDIDPANPRGWGIEIGGWSSGVIADNLLTKNPNCNQPSGIIVSTAVNLTVERNLIHDWRAGIRINGSGSSVSGLRLLGNKIQESTSTDSLLVHADSSSVGSVVQAGDNRFHRQLGNSSWIQNGGSTITLQNWKTLVGDTTSSMQQLSFTGASRDLASYNASRGRTGTYEAFVVELRLQSKDNWRTEYEAINVANWIREGFGMTVQ